MTRRNGLYVQLDVNTPNDPKIIEAGERAELLYYRGLMFCKANWHQDGFITDGQLVRVAPDFTLLSARVRALVSTGLWQRVDEDLFGRGAGYQVTAWLDRNPSRAQIEAKRRADAERKRLKDA